jgi:molecular chaperone HscB
MNYFEFYDIPISFKVDEEAVKKKYLEFSRKFHPDFFINQSSEKQQEVLDMSTLNTRAFQTLSDFDKRMKYILELKNMIYEGERYELSPDFLMEMMEINEAMMEMEEKNVAGYKTQVAGLLSDLFEDVRGAIENYNDDAASENDMKKIKDYYYKKKYLLRLKQSLDTFGDS